MLPGHDRAVLSKCHRSPAEDGRSIDDTLLSHLSPVGWEHINLTGDYVWHANKRVAKGRFRPMRKPQDSSSLVARRQRTNVRSPKLVLSVRSNSTKIAVWTPRLGLVLMINFTPSRVSRGVIDGFCKRLTNYTVVDASSVDDRFRLPQAAGVSTYISATHFGRIAGYIQGNSPACVRVHRGELLCEIW